MRFLCLLGFLLAGSLLTARAQSLPPTNLEQFQRLARSCLTLPDSLEAFRLEAPDTLPYVKTALEAAWLQEGRRLYTSAEIQFPIVRYRITTAQVTYAGLPRRQVVRHVTLVMQYALQAPDGRVLLAASCQPVVTDTVARTLVVSLEHPAFPETQAPLPTEQPGLLTRYLMPAIALTATALSVYLLFTLRSRTTTDAATTP
jgi:hypothetical protein